jgi:WD40 repeat protein/GTPase SAR1 family protein
MSGFFFISYSRVDGKEFAMKLADELAADPTIIDVWLDSRSLRPGLDWDEQLGEAIKTCKAMLFVMSRDSVRPDSVCKSEWVRALKYKKPVIPLLLDSEAQLPFRLGSREYINFSGPFDSGLAWLRKHLAWMESSQGQLQALKYRLSDAQRELPRAEPDQQARIREDIGELERQIAQQQKVIDNPKAAEQRLQQSIETGLEGERKPATPVGGIAQGKFINPPPLIAPTWFQNRHIETGLIGNFLRDESRRLMTVVGRGGVGKTALVCRLLRSLESGQLPDDGGPLTVDGIVYLSGASSFHRTNFPDLYAGLSKLLPDETVKQLDAVYRNPENTASEVMKALLEAFPRGRTVVLLDSFEYMLAVETLAIKDNELDAALRALLDLPAHGLKVIITTRLAPRTLLLVRPELQDCLELDTGLKHPYAENFLRAMDVDGKVGLKGAPETLLAEARERTLGYPRALEHLFGILSADRDTSLQEIVENTRKFLPEQIMAVLVDEAFSRLDLTAQRVMLALAVYRDPIPPAAVDYLLQPYVPGIDSRSALSRLVNKQFARRDAGRYYMHQIDRDYALSRIVEGDPSDRDSEAPLFTRFALRHRAAEWFKLTRKPRDTWKTLGDLTAQLSEFELRCVGPEYDTAARILLNIGDQLLKWGHHRLLLELHERLQGRIVDDELNRLTLAELNKIRRLIKPSGFELQQTLSGHDTPITRLAWFPDGEKLASASVDGSIRIWDLPSRRLRETLKGHTDSVLAVRVTSDSSRIVSGSADATIKIWDVATGSVIKTLVGHESSVTGVALLPNGRIISTSRDHTLRIWNQETGESEITLRGHTGGVNAVALTPDRQHAVSAASDGTLKIWNLVTFREEYTLAAGAGGDNDVTVFRDGKLVASAGTDATIRLWNLSTRQQTQILEGPTAPVTGIASSPEGDLLTAKSADGHIRTWRCDTWQEVADLSEPSASESGFAAGVAFAPSSPLLATLGDEDMVIRIWNLDRELLFNIDDAEEPVRYATAKIALVGDSGVGKTSLGWRLATSEFKEQPSTHGQHFWLINELRQLRPDRTECEVILWDFAGQADYRLVHALLLDHIDIGLLLFDAAERQEPLKAVNYWLRQLLFSHTQPKTILVGARIDRGAPTLVPDDLQEYCEKEHISGGYVATSALSGEGLPKLIERIMEQLKWDDMPPTVSPRIFGTIKEKLLSLRSAPSGGNHERQAKVLLTPVDLSKELAQMSSGALPQFTYEQMMTAVAHLAKHGLVSILKKSSGEEVILLFPDLLNNLAASIVLEARRTNFGTIDEDSLLRSAYSFPELDGVKKEEKEILLDAAAILFLKHNLCFRQVVKNKTVLVFPSLINQKRPVSNLREMTDDVSYTVSGQVETVYPALVVQLGATNEFVRTYAWQNQAQYEMGPNEVCGFYQVESGEGQIELVLYYASEVPDYVQRIFQGYVDKFLSRHKIEFTRYPRIHCTNAECKKLQERESVVKKMREGLTFHFCGYCGTKIALPVICGTTEVRNIREQRLDHQQVLSNYRTSYEARLVTLKRIAANKGPAATPPQCFISYAWGVAEHEKWVLRLATDLRHAGIGVVIDRWNNAEPGSSISRFISLIKACHYIAVVGTHEYRKKYENASTQAGHVVAAEWDLISNRLLGTESDKRSILPLLLAGDVEEAFPPLLHGRVYVDFRRDDQYFRQLLDAVIKILGLPFDDNGVIELRETQVSFPGD